MDWTLGFESSGTLEAVREDLRRAAKPPDRCNCPDLASGIWSSYPVWLRTGLAADS
jgi:hypothetical protein